MGYFSRLFPAAVLLLSMGAVSFAHADSEIDGVGATFPMPIMQSWAEAYQSQKNIKVNYLGIGSAEGIKRITARTVDFAVTDIGLTQSELSQDDLMQFPLVAGGITPVIHLPGISSGQLRLTGSVLADIFLGKVTYWDDVAIQNLNATISLPHLAITVIHRKDGSGTSFTFTSYLAKVSPEWDQRFGIGSSLQWPVGEAAVGNSGIAKTVAQTEGSIGYVEFRYAQKSNLTTINLINRDGNNVAPSLDTFMQAYKQAHWHKASYYQSLTDLPGANSWPIVAMSYVLIHATRNEREDALQTLHFLEWIYANGALAAQEASYIPITDEALIQAFAARWKQVKDEQGNAVLK